MSELEALKAHRVAIVAQWREQTERLRGMEARGETGGAAYLAAVLRWRRALDAMLLADAAVAALSRRKRAA